MGMAAQNDSDVGQVEPEPLHVLFDEGNRSLEIRVDEDVPLGGRNQKPMRVGELRQSDFSNNSPS